MAGVVLMTIGSLIAGIPNAFNLMRLFRLFVVVVNRVFWRPLYQYAERKFRLG